MIHLNREEIHTNDSNQSGEATESLGTQTNMTGSPETSPDATTSSSEFLEHTEQSGSQTKDTTPEVLVGTGEFREYIDTPEEAKIVAECKAIVDSLFKIHSPQDIPTHKKWCEDRDALIKSLMDSGITSAELDECRMYHVLASSTPSDGTIRRFDLANSDEIIDFIRNYKKRNGLE